MKKNAHQLWYVYIVKCNDGTLYTGYTNDVTKRVAKHNAGKGAKYTRGRRPVKVIGVWEYPSRSLAMRAEYMIKHLTRDEKITMCLVLKYKEDIARLE